MFNELKIGLVLRAAYEDFLAKAPRTLDDCERLRILFLTRWNNLPALVQGACVLASMIDSPACQGTAEVIEWRRIHQTAATTATRERVVAERLN